MLAPGVFAAIDMCCWDHYTNIVHRGKKRLIVRRRLLDLSMCSGRGKDNAIARGATKSADAAVSVVVADWWSCCAAVNLFFVKGAIDGNFVHGDAGPLQLVCAIVLEAHNFDRSIILNITIRVPNCFFLSVKIPSA